MKGLNWITLALVFTLSVAAQAQEYKIAKTSGRLELNVGRVTVEGTDGNEIIFSSTNGKVVKDERAAGLRPINSLGLQDNTGLGINVADKGNVVEVHQLKKTEVPNIKVLVPKGIIVSFSHQSQFAGTARFVNLPNEIEVSAVYNSVELKNVTGPLTVETTYGNVTADMVDGSVKGPLSIVSVYGFIDITLPLAIKADVRLSTSYGEIYAAPEFNMKVASSEEGMNVYGDKVTGTINGGGIKIDLTSNYGKIYLRKK